MERIWKGADRSESYLDNKIKRAAEEEGMGARTCLG